MVFWQNFGQNHWKISVGRHLGDPKPQKCYQDKARHQESTTEEFQDCPKKAESCPQFDPSEANGRQIRGSTIISRAKSIENRWKICQNWCQDAENLKSVKSTKSMKKQRFFNDFRRFLVFWSMENHEKTYFFNNKWLGGSFFVKNWLKLRKRSGKLWNRRAQSLPKGRKHWKNGVWPAQGAPQCCGPRPRGREGKGINPLPRDWEGRDLWI